MCVVTWVTVRFPFLPQHDKLIKPLSLTKDPGFNSRLNNPPNYYSEVLAILIIFVLIHLMLTISIVRSSWFCGLLCSLALEPKMDRPPPTPPRPCQLRPTLGWLRERDWHGVTLSRWVTEDGIF